MTKALVMKAIIFVILGGVLFSCSTPNNAASNRISTAPMSIDPSTTLPGTGAQPPYNNRVEQRTGTSPAPNALPDNNNGSSGADSTAHR